MAAQPKKKLSRSRSRKRSSTKIFKGVSLATCQNCKQYKIPHTVCSNCGFYRGKQVIAKKETIKIKKVEENER